MPQERNILEVSESFVLAANLATEELDRFLCKYPDPEDSIPRDSSLWLTYDGLKRKKFYHMMSLKLEHRLVYYAQRRLDRKRAAAERRVSRRRVRHRSRRHHSGISSTTEQATPRSGVPPPVTCQQLSVAAMHCCNRRYWWY
ncbi:hypothetical protein KIPB_005313 [Kipferlia bialata]|uniref:Uncharacterized protein n=1 Tax=Kipferlia bialata TaxID=797122 RepID=A0A9K3GI14_9EUKA|nr:hypothetical protein KIPB_005313 [Kipferlia bialata]|eukprot:g5313.t1